MGVCVCVCSVHLLKRFSSGASFVEMEAVQKEETNRVFQKDRVP